jgi:hypothetical protein
LSMNLSQWFDTQTANTAQLNAGNTWIWSHKSDDIQCVAKDACIDIWYDPGVPANRAMSKFGDDPCNDTYAVLCTIVSK